MKKISFIFFGSSSFSINVLNTLERKSLLPIAVVTMPDKPKGRNLMVAETEVAQWATIRKIDVLKFETLKDVSVMKILNDYEADLFIVASYGKIIPESILYIPKHKTLNIHPSLLPKYRGASPIQSMILENEQHTGVTIMKLDKEMDHGPIVASKEIAPPTWPTHEETVEAFLGNEGGILLASILSDWTTGKIVPKTQNHDTATYTKKMVKDDAQLDLNGDAFKNYLKILAYHRWPKAFFFDTYKGKNIRMIITDARYDMENNTLEFIKVIPESKKEMLYSDYLKGKNNNI